MGFTFVAVLAGLTGGLAAGGRLANVSRRPLRVLGALGAAVVLQALPVLIDVGDATALACILGSYALLLAFTAANLRLVGMPVVLLGLVLNIAVITLNAGMPVRAEALLTVERDLAAADLAAVDFGAKRHLETGEDRLAFLGDVVPVRVLGEVLSFGDLILAVGIADVVFRLLGPTAAVRRRRRLGEGVGGPQPATLG